MNVIHDLRHMVPDKFQIQIHCTGGDYKTPRLEPFRARQARCPEGAGGTGNPTEQTEYPGDFVAMCGASEHGDESRR